MTNSFKTWWQQINATIYATPELISFNTIRLWVGFLGLSLPLVLYLGTRCLGHCDHLQPSISHFYYTNMREVFVGVLCAVALFFFTYKGYSKIDGMATNAAGFFALCVAMFPTNLLEDICQHCVVIPVDFPNRTTVHFICASAFFLILAAMSFFLFTKSDVPKEQRSKQKKYRNIIYRVCGVGMAVSLIIIALGFWVFKMSDYNPLTFWCETSALIFFGTSWLVKGEALKRIGL